MNGPFAAKRGAERGAPGAGLAKARHPAQRGRRGLQAADGHTPSAGAKVAEPKKSTPRTVGLSGTHQFARSKCGPTLATRRWQRNASDAPSMTFMKISYNSLSHAKICCGFSLHVYLFILQVAAGVAFCVINSRPISTTGRPRAEHGKARCACHSALSRHTQGESGMAGARGLGDAGTGRNGAPVVRRRGWVRSTGERTCRPIHRAVQVQAIHRAVVPRARVACRRGCRCPALCRPNGKAASWPS